MSDTDISDTLMNQVALRNFKGLALNLACAGFSCYFMNSAWQRIGTVAFTVASQGGSYLFGKWSSEVIMDIYHLRGDETEAAVKERRICNQLLWMLQCTDGILNGLIHIINRDILIHETGHYAIIQLLFATRNPRLLLQPFSLEASGMVTYSNSSNLTSVGMLIGLSKSSTLISAAGSAASILTATGLVLVSHHIEKKNPYFSRILNYMVLMSIFCNLSYTLSVFYTSIESGHDFINLAKAGISPLQSGTYIVATPLATKCSLIFFDRFLKPSRCAQRLEERRDILT